MEFRDGAEAASLRVKVAGRSRASPSVCATPLGPGCASVLSVWPSAPVDPASRLPLQPSPECPGTRGWSRRGSRPERGLECPLMSSRPLSLQVRCRSFYLREAIVFRLLDVLLR